VARESGNGRKGGGEALLQALAGGLSVPRAAEAAGLSRRTAYRRLKDPDFRRRVGELRTELFERAAGRLGGAGGRAAAVLAKLLGSADEKTRLAAARAILELGPRVRDAAEIARRLDELERRVNGQHGGPEG
jgi:hypothetical protein